MAYQDFLNDYKSGKTGSALAFYGAEDFLMSWALDKIIEDNVEEEYRNLDVRFIEGEEATAYEIMGEARAYSMFSPKRIIVVRDYLPMHSSQTDAGQDELTDFAAAMAKDKSKGESPSILIFVLSSMYAGNINAYGKSLLKACSSYEFSRLDKRELNGFVIKRVRDAGKMIASRELSHLVDVTGYYNRESKYNLSQLEMDISKLIGACEDDSIDMALIDEVMMGDSDKFVFNLVDALTAGDRGKALELTENIIREGDSVMGTLALLTKQFEIMYDSLELSDKGMSMAAMAKETGVNEYRFKKAYSAARGYGKKTIKSLLVSLYDIDKDIKNGNMEGDVALELFAIKAAR